MNYTTWAKKNYFTMIGIIIILAVVWWYYAAVEVRIVDTIAACNAHWTEQVSRICPAATAQYAAPTFAFDNVTGYLSSVA